MTNTYCAICLNEYIDKDLIYNMLDCTHNFHNNCIKQWVNTGATTCPLCRIEVPIIQYNILEFLDSSFIDSFTFDLLFRRALVNTKHNFTDNYINEELLYSWLPIFIELICLNRALSILVTIPKYFKNDNILVMKVLYKVFKNYKITFITEFWPHKIVEEYEVLITDNDNMFNYKKNNCFCIYFKKI